MESRTIRVLQDGSYHGNRTGIQLSDGMAEEVIARVHTNHRELGSSVYEHYRGIRIAGSVEFARRTRIALDLVHAHGFHDGVRQHLGIIQECDRSGVAPERVRPTFRAGPRIWKADTLWYASTIVHEAFHSKLFHENRRRVLCIRFTPTKCWKGPDAERKCLSAQLEFLRVCGADEDIIHYVLNLIVDPSYCTIPWNKRTW